MFYLHLFKFVFIRAPDTSWHVQDFLAKLIKTLYYCCGTMIMFLIQSYAALIIHWLLEWGTIHGLDIMRSWYSNLRDPLN